MQNINTKIRAKGRYFYLSQILVTALRNVIWLKPAQLAKPIFLISYNLIIILSSVEDEAGLFKHLEKKHEQSITPQYRSLTQQIVVFEKNAANIIHEKDKK